jgi:hypothetical protein
MLVVKSRSGYKLVLVLWHDVLVEGYECYDRGNVERWFADRVARLVWEVVEKGKVGTVEREKCEV